VTPGQRIVRWNPAMQVLTGIAAIQAIGSRVAELKSPWGAFLQAALDEPDSHVHKRALRLPEEWRWLSLHKTAIAEPGRGETGDRLLLVEDVTEVQRLEDELAHSERLASIGRLAAGVAHEIGNPVTGIACLAQEIRAESSGELPVYAEQILQQTQRINTIVQTLVSYAHGGIRGEHRLGPVAVAEAVAEAIRVVQLGRRARTLRFENAIEPTLRVTGDSQRLIQVFVNLFTNAVDACGDRGNVRISARVTRRMVHIRVVDDGPGIPSAIQHKILEPFFTTKEPGRGTGLGLPLVYNILRDFSGDLRIRSGRRGGTEVLLILPVATSKHGKRYA
jgi:signal transduction histidine kinase